VTREQIEGIESIVITLASGVALAYPPAAPIVAALKGLVEAAEDHGIVPTELSAEQAASIAAGMAAARASAVTAFKMRGRR